MRNRMLRRIVTAVSVSGMCLSFASGSYAAWKISGDTDNLLTMASYKNVIVEQYRQPDHVDPSEVVSKVVNVSNTGDVDSIVRVSVTKQFGIKNADGSFTVDEGLDPEMIMVEYNTTSWVEKDGYFYYREILKAGETTKEPLMTSFLLSPLAGNEYKGKSARILVQMESTQAEGNAVSAWETTYQELGMEEPKALSAKPTGVTYQGKEKGFDITKSRTDLFANFKNLLPGCARTQVIRIANASAENVEIFLHAEATDQEIMTDKQLSLVNEMLEKYAVIEVSSGRTVIYKGPVSGNLGGSGSTMKRDISLGVFEPSQSVELTVKLELDPEMDNQYESLVGKVKWVFSAEGEEEKTVSSASIYPAQTGLVKKAAVSFVLFLFCMGICIVSIFCAGAEVHEGKKTWENE